jgi:hypothetical protein
MYPSMSWMGTKGTEVRVGTRIFCKCRRKTEDPEVHIFWRSTVMDEFMKSIGHKYQKGQLNSLLNLAHVPRNAHRTHMIDILTEALGHRDYNKRIRSLNIPQQVKNLILNSKLPPNVSLTPVEDLRPNTRIWGKPLVNTPNRAGKKSNIPGFTRVRKFPTE